MQWNDIIVNQLIADFDYFKSFDEAQHLNSNSNMCAPIISQICVAHKCVSQLIRL